MARGADGIAHVVQAVEHRDQVVLRSAIARGGRYVEAGSIRHPGFLGTTTGGVDRSLVVVRADEYGVRERLGHEDRRGAVAAADVCHQRGVLQLLDYTVESGEPLGRQVGVVA